MTTRPSPMTEHPPGSVRLPDPPTPEDMNNYIYFNSLGNGLHLAEHLGNPDTTIITSEVYISREPTTSRRGLMAPDLLIAFNVNPESYQAGNGYIISHQGKPPDFVLEIGSPSTGRRDVREKRTGYAALGIPEYWRFDPSGGQHHGAPLAGDRLVDDAYESIPIEQLAEESWQGYSSVLNLHLRWEGGQLGWYNPATGRHIPRFGDEREARIAAQERVRELEAELERYRRAE